ncbi:MAG: hypothetical protein GVY18_17050 [Bacteroidetes bacterium]|jgi:hypothetical protein|nr:hypothetical protein [Bacteroidota bacterium]
MVCHSYLARLIYPVALAALLAVGACGGDGEPSPATPAEPNDQIGEASPVALDAPLALTIQPAGDVDWLQVEVPGPGYLDVQAGTIPEDIGLEVAFARHAQWDAEKENWIRTWQAPPVAIPVTEAGTYHLAVQDDFGDAASETPIELRIRHLDPFDAHEPNDTPEGAAPATPGEPLSLAVFPKGDQDWFTVEVPARRYLEAQARTVPDAFGLEVTFATYDAWSGERTTLRGWGGLPRALFVPDSTTIHVGLQDDFGDARSTDTFQVRLLLRDDLDAYEPNDEAITAADIQRGDTLSVAIYPVGDRDVFRLSLPAGDTLRVRALDPPDLTPEAALFRFPTAAQEALEQTTDWTKLPATLPTDAAGPYYLILHDDFDDERAYEAFPVIVQ